MLVFAEHRSDGTDLVSLATWRSPIAMTFHSSPVQANGRICQLRRVIAVTSNTAFEVTEDLSIDGGPFKRLGNAHYTKSP
jgi:hypothetical protein